MSTLSSVGADLKVDPYEILEKEAQRELYLSRRRRGLQDLSDGRQPPLWNDLTRRVSLVRPTREDNGCRRRIGHADFRRRKVRAVEDVEHLRAELDSPIGPERRHRGVLRKRDVEIHERRSSDAVARRIAEEALGRNGENARVEPEIRRAHRCAGRNEIAAARDAR